MFLLSTKNEDGVGMPVCPDKNPYKYGEKISAQWQVTMKWLIWFGPKSSLTKILYMSP